MIFNKCQISPLPFSDIFNLLTIVRPGKVAFCFRLSLLDNFTKHNKSIETIQLLKDKLKFYRLDDFSGYEGAKVLY